ncbi:MAG: hypothetical protein AB9866_15095 [Syntrophobacteraceae bacterium]
MIRDKEIATKISLLMLEFGARIDDSILLVKEHCSYEEFHMYRMAAGRVMGEMLLNIMNPIYTEHPELKPSELE